jgi:hypothetical protein
MKTNILSLILIFTISISFAQKFNFSKTSKKVVSKVDKVCAEKTNGNLVSIFFVGKLKIEICDLNGVKKAKIKESFNLQNKIYRTTHTNNKGIYVFYETLDGLYVKTFGYDGLLKKEQKLMEKPKLKVFTTESQLQHIVMFNEDKSHFVIYQGTNYWLHQLMCKDKDKPESMEYFEISGGREEYFFAKKFTVYDMDFNLKSTYKTNNKDFPTYSAHLSKDGSLYFIEPSSKTELVKVQNNVVTKVPFSIEKVGVFKPFLKEQDGKLMVATTIGIDNFSVNEDKVGGRLHLMYFSVNYQLFNASDLKREYSHYYDFTKNEIEKSWTKDEADNKRKFAGITYLKIADLKLVNTNEIIATMYQKNDVTSYLKFSNIYLNKVTPKGIEKSIMIDRIDSGKEVYYGDSSFPLTVLYNNKYYLFYTKNDSDEIGYKEFDFNLKETKTYFENFQKEGKREPLLHLSTRHTDKLISIPGWLGKSIWTIEF